MYWCAAVLFCSLCLTFARESSTQCTSTEYMKFCSLESKIETLKLFEDQLLVGAADALLSYGLDLQQRISLDLTSDDNTLEKCINNNVPRESCRNIIKVVEYIPNSDKILVCGTYSTFPKCSLHKKNQLTDFSVFPSGVSEAVGYSPYKINDFIIPLITSNQRFFSATIFRLQDAQPTIGMSPHPLQSNVTFTVMDTATKNDKKFNVPIRIVSAHEHWDYVYFFITESALELKQSVNDKSNFPQYTRAVRICNTDEGIGKEDIENNRFLSFQKARMECRIREGGSSDVYYFYDHLKSTFMGSEDGASVLYGTFNSPINGPKGGAICKFSFSPNRTGSLTNVFEDGIYNVRTSDSDRYVWTMTPNVPSFTCSNINRTQSDADKYDLVYNPVTSVPDTERPLFVSDGEYLDKITAETFTYKQDVQEVLYYSNQLGQIKQVVLSSANSGRSFIHNVVEETDTNENGDVEEVQQLILRKESDNARSLYVSRGQKIMQIYRGRCSLYVNCQDCLTSRDPYCGWDSTSKSCVNKLTKSTLVNLTQSFSASDSDIMETCKIMTFGQTTSSPNSCPPGLSTSGPSSGAVVKNSTAEGFLPMPSSSKVSLPAVVGASAGAFVVGLFVGLSVCLIFLCKTYVSSKRKSDKVQDDCNVASTSNSTSNGNIELGLEPTKTDISLNNKDIKDLDKNPAPIEIKEPLKPTPPPRYVDHALPSTQPAQQPVNFNVVPQSTISNNISTHVANGMAAVGSSNTLPKHTRSNSKEANKFDFSREEDNDSAFAERDIVPPLKSFPSTSTTYGSLGRNKVVGGFSGIARRQVPNHKIPRGRTDSSTWLRQESVSSDVSSLSPLQSPISDV